MFAYLTDGLHSPLDYNAGAKAPGIADMSFCAPIRGINNTSMHFILACFIRTAGIAVPGWQFHYR